MSQESRILDMIDAVPTVPHTDLADAYRLPAERWRWLVVWGSYIGTTQWAIQSAGRRNGFEPIRLVTYEYFWTGNHGQMEWCAGAAFMDAAIAVLLEDVWDDLTPPWPADSYD